MKNAHGFQVMGRRIPVSTIRPKGTEASWMELGGARDPDFLEHLRYEDAPDPEAPWDL